MFKYYKNKRVKIKRFFMLDGVHYSVINFNGEEISVPTSDLSDRKSELIQNSKEMKSTVAKINPDGSEVWSEIIQTEGEPCILKTSSSDGIVADSESIIHLNLNGGTPIEDSHTEVIATNNSGKEINLGAIDSLENSEQVKKLKFDIEAIQRCLDGKQKRHKNYTFTLKEAAE